MEGNMEKKPIVETLRNMPISGQERFPLSQKRSVENTMYNRLAEERVKGFRWSIKTDMQSGVIVVTRVS